MSKAKNLFSFVLTPENKNELRKFAKEYNTTMSKMLNYLIVDFVNKPDKKLNKNNEILDNSSKRIEVKSHFTTTEYQELKLLAEKEGLSVKRYVKFLVSQKIYDKDTPSNAEIFKLQEIVNQLIKLGVNMNSVAKKLNSNNDLNIDMIDIRDLLESTLKNIADDRKNFQHKISIFKKINNSRF